MNILIVEDNKDMREMLCEMLESQGHTVYTVLHGREAIELLMVHTIDLIISDILMPEIDGIEFMFRLRQSGIPVIAISGLDHRQIIESILSSLGIMGILSKPIKTASLLELISQAGAMRVARSSASAAL